MTTDTQAQSRHHLAAIEGRAAPGDAREAREHLVQALLDAVTGMQGNTPPAARELAIAVGRARASGAQPPAPEPPLGATWTLIDAVADRAHDVSEELVRRALASGRSEHEVFDLIVAAAVGAGVGRRELGLHAIDRHCALAAGWGVLP